MGAACRLETWVWWSGTFFLIGLGGLGVTPRKRDNIFRHWRR